LAAPTAEVVAPASGKGPAASIPLVRVASMLAYVVALMCWVRLMGLPKQALPAFGWIWLATIAWNIRAPVRAHLEFLRDWSPPLAVLTVYLYSRGLADDLGFVSVHVTEPIEADRWLFGGTLPTEFLQAKLCGDPCDRTASAHWYDAVLTTVYYSHFVVALTVASVLWLRDRNAWARFMRRYLSLSILALAVYITYPMAPPWLAAQDGLITDDIARITGRGWYDLREGNFHQKLSAVGNPVAAMPSLHAGIALFVALHGVSRLRSRWRWLLLLYPLVMSFMLVYYAEHYVVDVVAGFAAAGLVLWGCAVWERSHVRQRRRVRRSRRPVAEQPHRAVPGGENRQDDQDRGPLPGTTRRHPAGHGEEQWEGRDQVARLGAEVPGRGEGQHHQQTAEHQEREGLTLPEAQPVEAHERGDAEDDQDAGDRGRPGQELRDPLREVGSPVEAVAPPRGDVEVAGGAADLDTDTREIADETEGSHQHGQRGRPQVSLEMAAPWSVRPHLVDVVNGSGDHDRGDHGGSRRPGQTGQRRQDPGGDPPTGQDGVHGPRGAGCQQRLGVGHGLDHAHRQRRPEDGRNDADASAVEVVGYREDPPGSRDRRHGADEQSGIDALESGDRGHPPFEPREERKEGVVGEQPAFVDAGEAVPVLGNARIPPRVPLHQQVVNVATLLPRSGSNGEKDQQPHTDERRQSHRERRDSPDA
jgi:hypothetical protein